jgi:hypothetical protein
VITRRFSPRGPLGGLIWALRGSPGARAFATGHRLRHRNLPCVWPLAVIERRGPVGIRESVLILERRCGNILLGELLEQSGPDTDRWSDIAFRRSVLESVGRLLADACRSGVRWADPKPSGVSIELTAGPAPPRVLIGRFDDISFEDLSVARLARESLGAFVRNMQRCAGFEPKDEALVRQAFQRRLGQLANSGSGRPS